MALTVKGKWKPVAIDCNDGFDINELQGLVSFEELADYTVTEEGQGEVIKAKTVNNKKKKKKKKKPNDARNVNAKNDCTRSAINMEAWSSLFIPEAVMKALSELSFTTPTPIQSLSLPAAIRDRKDVVGTAETGSGKTLAYGIPVIQRILQLKDIDSKAISEIDKSTKRKRSNSEEAETPKDKSTKKTKVKSENMVTKIPSIHQNDSSSTERSIEEHSHNELGTKDIVYALVLTPTRELALQVRDHLRSAAKYTNLKIEAIVGGISQLKQHRLLNRRPEIIIATPGRIWQMMSDEEGHLQTLNKLPLLVLDEVDRMIESGHFAELTYILERLPIHPKRQTLVYSATLTTSKQGQTSAGTTQLNQSQCNETFDTLVHKLKLGKKVALIDLTEKTLTVERLVEARIDCMSDEKMIYMFMFCLLFPGKTLVFANAVGRIKKISFVLHLLGLTAYPLHAKMQQRQRLKNLDRFKSSSHGILIATDVAARGIDIKDIQYVFHYDLPKATQLYIHRSGRTARASSKGMSMVLVCPEDMKSYKTITKDLRRDIPEFPIDDAFYKDIKRRVVLAENIFKMENSVNKSRFNSMWIKTKAKATGLELEDEEIDIPSQDSSELKKKIKSQKDKLARYLKLPLITSEFSGKFPTMMGNLSAPGIDNYVTESKDDDIKAISFMKSKKQKNANP